MTRASAPPLLLQLQNAETLSAQAAALRSLKNETIGHDQRKESWVRWGILPVLANILAARQSPGKGTASAELNGGSKLRYPTSEEDEACLQAVIILGSLAQGGAAFLSPIFASGVLPALLSILSAPGCPSFFVLPILRTLNNVADRLPLQSQQLSSKDTRLADLLFSNDHIGCLARILGQEYESHHDQAAIELTASLVGKLCTEEIHKAILAECGVLDALAVKVASFIVAQGFVLPGAEAHVQDTGALGSLPAPAPAGAKLAPILRAVTVIIEHSKWRAEHFLSSPGILTVFPRQLPEFAPTDIKKGPWGSTYFSGSAVPRHAGASPLEHLLPSVPLSQSKSPANTPNFPPLGHQGTTHRRHSQSYSTPMSAYDPPTSEDEENPIIPWLLYIVRAEGGMVRLMAARLVTVLFRLGLTKKRRVSMLCYLLIPILIRMLDKDYEMNGDDGVQYGGLIPSTERLREEAPFVLATLVIDDFELQRHAVDGNAIKRLSQLLKETYNPVQDVTRPMWHADAEESIDSPPDTLPAERRLGSLGFSPVHCHIMRYRENILKALAALVPFKDEYRKAVCENGVVPYIIDSLKPCSDDQSADPSGPKNTASHGNPTSTLLAACGAARMLTRSVSVLRTSMIDAGVATPLFVLIKHPNIEVQIAATQVICNLALDFSPMKEAIITADVLPTLCEHAHSPNTKLRIESLWALKHVAYNSTNDVKVRIIDGLSPAYIRQIITQDPTNALAKRGMDEEMDNGSNVGMGRANSAGEQVDLLNPVDNAAGQDEDMKMADTMPPSKMSLDMFLPDATRRRKLALHGNLDQTTQARQDDIAVQEQTFDLLRNIICGPGAAEMIDHLFKVIGQDLILDALADKLRPRSIQLPHRGESSAHRPLSVPTEILVSVTFVMIHLAAGLPWHRQLLVSHRDLLRYLMGYFNHTHREVRTNCVWVVINLTYKDDASEEEGCRERAFRLRAMGVIDRLSSLGDDPDLDVRERTRTAQDLVNHLTHT
ncbi:armadillo repeat protein [Aspergillus costaricaensis CBS 115574]|uniref:Armadillo repeat protein n=1 Tax=Aspergillus costaricaensis CBS 115574 TaxID=1448317 RepID=A0ACD1INL6_9EURO|nr:armadillo repeat protein [Aspergillus costaricaensis CBS 115574]RAK92171.1 armadillo repeat protein [Aspergillus costaricaensis CBS 115574]